MVAYVVNYVVNSCSRAARRSSFDGGAMKNRLLSLIVVTFVLLALATPAAAAQVPITTVVSYDPAASEFTEGLAIDHLGTIFSGMAYTTEIRRVSRDGVQTTLAVLDPSGQSLLLGLALDKSGNVYAALPSNDPALNGVWRITPRGAVSRYAATDPAGAPNGLAFDDRGNLYVSDSILGVIWRIPQGGGEVRPWAADPLLAPDPVNGSGFGANGIALSDQAIYVANTDRALVARFPLLSDGRAGRGRVFSHGDELTDADGIAFDLAGNLYVACSLDSNRLVRVSTDGNARSVLATSQDGLDYSASLAFGTGLGERKSLFISNVGTNFGRPSVMKANVGVPGRPLP
jgi:sugar lactone lactonase YvrE